MKEAEVIKKQSTYYGRNEYINQRYPGNTENIEDQRFEPGVQHRTDLGSYRGRNHYPIHTLAH
jgi:hypothetical protein